MDDMEEEVVSKAYKQKGRGHKGSRNDDSEMTRGGQFESVDGSGGGAEVKSVEGWIVFAANVHEEAQEDDILDKFGDFGEVKNIHVNLDRRTGFVKGYALIEFETFKEAQNAITNLNGHLLLEQEITVDWAFNKPPVKGRRN